MNLLIHLSIVVLCFVALTRICDGHFIPALDRIARRYKMSNDAAGATLMAVGSSAAELFIAIIALIKPGHHADLGIGTIVGSAIFNILAIVGAAAIVREIHLSWHKTLRDLGFYALSIALLFASFGDGVITIFEALAFIGLYIAYVVTVIYWKKIERKYLKQEKSLKEQVIEDFEEMRNEFFQMADRVLDYFFPKKNYFLSFLISISAIALLSWMLVESAVKISEILQVPEIIIGLTILAVGSSVPDLISSIIVSKQNRGEMAISNAIGSNVFDILFGLGFPWLLFMLLKSEEVLVNNAELEISVILLFASIFVLLGMGILRRWKFGKISGALLIALYCGYLGWIVISTLTPLGV